MTIPSLAAIRALCLNEYGWPAERIADHFGISSEQVSNILSGRLPVRFLTDADGRDYPSHLSATDRAHWQEHYHRTVQIDVCQERARLYRFAAVMTREHDDDTADMLTDRAEDCLRLERQIVDEITDEQEREWLSFMKGTTFVEELCIQADVTIALSTRRDLGVTFNEMLSTYGRDYSKSIRQCWCIGCVGKASA